MTTFAVALKDEIRRLARKEVKAHTGKYARAIAQYRREIARLKRQQQDQEKKIVRLASETNGSAKSSVADNDVGSSLRFSSKSVRAQRRRTGLSASDYAKLVGVSPLTIYNWEHGKSRPRNGQFTSLVALRGLGKRQAQSLVTQAAGKGHSPKRRARKPK